MLEDIQDKITRLIALYEGERQRAETLSKELSESRNTLQEQQRQIAELKKDRIPAVAKCLCVRRPSGSQKTDRFFGKGD